MSRDLYFYFRDIKVDLTEEDKQKIDKLFHSISIERQEGIKEYIAGKHHYNSAEGKKANSDMRLLRKQFKRLQLPQKKFYDYFKSIKEDLTVKDKQKIDELFHSLSIERQEGIKGYIAGKYHRTDAVGRKAKNDIYMLRDQFKRLQLPQKGKNFYDYFKSEEEELTVEDIRYIDFLFLEFPLENQRGILEYLQNKHLKNSFIARRARFDLGIMQNKFRDKKKKVLLKRLELLRVLRQVLNEEKANDELLRLRRKK